MPDLTEGLVPRIDAAVAVPTDRPRVAADTFFGKCFFAVTLQYGSDC